MKHFIKVFSSCCFPKTIRNVCVGKYFSKRWNQRCEKEGKHNHNTEEDTKICENCFLGMRKSLLFHFFVPFFHVLES